MFFLNLLYGRRVLQREIEYRVENFLERKKVRQDWSRSVLKLQPVFFEKDQIATRGPFLGISLNSSDYYWPAALGLLRYP